MRRAHGAEIAGSDDVDERTGRHLVRKFDALGPGGSPRAVLAERQIVEMPAASTPGMAPTRAMDLLEDGGAARDDVGVLCALGHCRRRRRSTLMAAARSGWKPRSTLSTLTKLRSSSPAPTSSMQASATSETTRMERMRSCLRPSPEPEPESLSVSSRLPEAMRRPGTSPKRTAASAAMSTVQPSAAPYRCAAC